MKGKKRARSEIKRVRNRKAITVIKVVKKIIETDKLQKKIYDYFPYLKNISMNDMIKIDLTSSKKSGN